MHLFVGNKETIDNIDSILKERLSTGEYEIFIIEHLYMKQYALCEVDKRHAMKLLTGSVKKIIIE